MSPKLPVEKEGLLVSSQTPIEVIPVHGHPRSLFELIKLNLRDIVLTFMLVVVTAESLAVGLELSATQRSIKRFNSSNQTYIDNHARTQRLICDVARSAKLPVSVNPTTGRSDCENR